jgi:hypothetical protein
MRSTPHDAGWLSPRGPKREFAALISCDTRRDKGASGQAVALHWSGRRCAPTALRCSVSWPRRKTHFAHCVRSVQTVATSQMTTRAAREATSPVLLGAPQARSSLPERAFAGVSWVFATRNTSAAARRVVPGGGDLCGGEERRPSGGARSALRRLTRRNCLSGVSAANAVSFATRLKAEHRSGVGATRPPPPPAGSARRAVGMHRQGRRPQMTAMSRLQNFVPRQPDAHPLCGKCRGGDGRTRATPVAFAAPTEPE